MRALVAVAASILVSTGALACEMDQAAYAHPDPSIAAKKDTAAPATVAKAGKATTLPASKPKQDTTLAASIVPKPVDYKRADK